MGSHVHMKEDNDRQCFRTTEPTENISGENCMYRELNEEISLQLSGNE